MFYFIIALLILVIMSDSNNPSTSQASDPTACVSTLSIPLKHILTNVFDLMPDDPICDAVNNAAYKAISDGITFSDTDIDRLCFHKTKN